MSGTPNLVHNEQLKLATTAINNIGVASVVTGVVVPLVSHVAASAPPGNRYWAFFMVLWAIVGFGCHITGRLMLKGLRP
jgi:hypothetical protein